jgi:hypothetical protein
MSLAVAGDKESLRQVNCWYFTSEMLNNAPKVMDSFERISHVAQSADRQGHHRGAPAVKKLQSS